MWVTIIKAFKMASILFLCLGLLLTGCKRGVEASSFSSTRFMMGTVVSLEVHGLPDKNGDYPDQDALEQAVVKALDRMWSVAKQTDRYDQIMASDVLQLSALAGTNQPLTVGEDIFTLIQRVQAYNHPEVDLTLGPVIDIWNLARENSLLPQSDQIKEALTLTGMNKLQSDPLEHQVYLTQAGMSLDFGAVAKGYAVQMAWESLAASGLPIYGIINGGGNIKTIGAKPDGSAWKIGLTDPANSAQMMGELQMNPNETVATSGDYQKFFDVEGIRYHHLLDPSSGYPAGQSHSVTIIASDGFDSDYYSTLLFILPVDKAFELAESLPEIEAVIISQDNDIYVTSGLEKRIKWNYQGGYQLVTP